MSNSTIDPTPIETRRANDDALDLIFREARTQQKWLPKPVSEELLREVYDLAKLGPTSANTTPLRIVFLTTSEAKERLLPAMMEANVEKTRAAPAVALLAYDSEFYNELHKLFPIRDIKPMFEGNPELAQKTALVNSSLQAAYFMLAARSVGLDCGPMAGFDAEKVNAEFFSESTWRINFVCNLGYGDPDGLWPRLPRLEFEEACQIL